jgi:predicted dehydrogenase
VSHEVNQDVKKVRMAVIGAGGFGKNHLRVIHESPDAELVAVIDTDRSRAAAAAEKFGCTALGDIDELKGQVDGAVVASPTTTHADIGCRLMQNGIDVLVEKPIASDAASANRLVEAAASNSRILQVGHLERFNPAVEALLQEITLPLFFEIHRLSLFSPRSLDVDVVLDLMIHDIEIVLAMTGSMPEDVRAAGVSILSERVDIANVRLAFPGGAVANLTASRVSTEKVRKLRLFQPHQYISMDYERQDAAAFTVSDGRQIGFRALSITKDEPLRRELESFFDSVRTRKRPIVGGEEASRALEVSLLILDKIEEHSVLVAKSLHAWKATSGRQESSLN